MTAPTNLPPVSSKGQGVVPVRSKPRGLAIASLVFGIVSVASAALWTVIAWLFKGNWPSLVLPPFLAIVLGVMASRFGARALNNVRDGIGGGRRMARAGRICCVVALIIVFATVVVVPLYILYDVTHHFY